MSKQWGHGFFKGIVEGEQTGKSLSGFEIAMQFRVLLSALVVAHKNGDEQAFYSTISIAQAVILQHTNLEKSSFKVFDCPDPKSNHGDHP